jgi:hypothetical protein
MNESTPGKKPVANATGTLAAGGEPPKVWRRPDGTVIACVEKIRLLNENFVELRQLAQDAFDDGLLMGCSERQMRDALRELFEGLTPSFPERHE